MALTFSSLNYGTQNNLGPSIPASQRATPISRRVLSLRFINSWREWARRLCAAAALAEPDIVFTALLSLAEGHGRKRKEWPER